LGTKPDERLEVGKESAQEVFLRTNLSDIALNEVVKQLWNSRGILAACIGGRSIKNAKSRFLCFPGRCLRTQARLDGAAVLEKAPHLMHRENWSCLGHHFDYRHEALARDILGAWVPLAIKVTAAQVTSPQLIERWFA
jgi:hypothetical protein